MQKVADLKGKIVATNAAGSAVDIAMRAMLRKHGLEDKRDYTVIEAPFPTMKAMLAQKKADLATFVAPFSFDPELRADRPAAVQPEGRDRHHADDRVGRAQGLPGEEPRRHGRFHGGLAARRALVSRSREPRRGGADRRAASPSSRPSGSPAGCSPTRTMPAAPTCCPTWRRCRPISTCSATSASSRRRSTCRNTPI